MTREEEIKSVIDTLFGEKGRTSEQVAVAKGFETGVRWADNHVDTSALWHASNHEPEEGELIVCIDEEDCFFTGAFYDERVDEYDQVYEKSVWDYGELISYWNDVKMWAYVKDILPKGGEE